MLVYSKKQAWIRILLFDKACTDVLMKYSEYSNIFLAENAAELLENTGINKYIIKLEEDKQPPFCPIHSLELVEFETLKTYIKTILANSFIRPFKSPTGVLILFNKKLDRSFRLYVNYWNFNNIIIKNQYPLPLISKLLN